MGNKSKISKKKKTRIKTGDRELAPEMLAHLEALGLSTLAEYKAWCQCHNIGFAKSKNRRLRDHERDIAARAKIEHVVTGYKKQRNIRAFIDLAYHCRVVPDEITSDINREIYSAFRISGEPDVLRSLLLYVESHASILKEAAGVRGVSALAQRYDNWVRPLETWKPTSHNTVKQFASLARHLFAVYPIPEFMDEAWVRNNTLYQQWFMHIGRGGNIRTAEGLPLKLTKKMAHYFLDAPKDYTIEGALRWGQIKAFGGDKRLAEALRETMLYRNFDNDDFWQTVVRFFIAHPMLDTVHIAPMIDYIRHQKFECTQVFVARGVAEERGPAQPNFSMKGRTPESLLRQVESWHRRLGRESKASVLQWTRCGLRDFEFQEGDHRKRNMKRWTIRELLTSRELVAEGRALMHCVATYARSCARGQTSIWTLEMQDDIERSKLLTIEVATSNKYIRQVRGKRNRLPTPKEGGVIQRWAAREGLEIAPYILR